LVFPQLCHGCGSCTLICPENAISESLNVMGLLEAGPTPTGIRFARGIVNVGEPMAVPIIRQLKRWEPTNGWTSAVEAVIADASPGTSCPVVETAHGADFALLVTEPTPFGLHDLRLMVEVVRDLGIPAGVIINRDGIGNAQVDEFCTEAKLPILMRIPLDRQVAQGIAQGIPLVHIRPDYVGPLRQLYGRIRDLVQEKDG
jgi:MinD superfamily P-loop ATPase